LDGRGGVSRVEVIRSPLITRRKVKYLLTGSRKATLASNISKFARDLSVMLAIYWRSGAMRFFHIDFPQP
jgi:hypothetical protein